MEVKDRISIFNQLKAERVNIDSDWQTVAYYVYTKKADFISESKESHFTNQNLYDKTASLSLNTRSSTLVSLLWDGGKFAYKPNSKYFKDDKAENTFFQYATETARREFKNAKADIIFAQSEKDEGAFGISYIFLDGGEGNGLNLIPFQVKECYIDETTNNKINILYRSYCITVRQAVDTFGIDYVSDQTKSSYNANKFNDKVEILHIIQPRKNRNVILEGVEHMPFESVYIDLKNNKELKKDGVQKGFKYFPVYISREGVISGEKYPYSVSMMAIEEIAQANKVREDEIVITNRMADPSIWYDSTALQGNIINTSPGSATAFVMQGRAGAPIGDMIPTQGDAQVTELIITRLQQTINSFYGIDRLIDFNNDTQMTLGEAQIRAQVRQQSLGDILISKRIEKYEPIVKRAFAILFEQGKFGYKPDDIRIKEEEALGLDPRLIPEDILELVQGGVNPIDLIDVEFYTQFELEKALLKNNTILQVWNNAGLIAQLTQNPMVFDNLDADKTIKEIGNVSFSIDIFREDEEVQEIRNTRAEQQNTQDTLNAGETLSKIDKNLK